MSVSESKNIYTLVSNGHTAVGTSCQLTKYVFFFFFCYIYYIYVLCSLVMCWNMWKGCIFLWNLENWFHFWNTQVLCRTLWFSWYLENLLPPLSPSSSPSSFETRCLLEMEIQPEYRRCECEICYIIKFVCSKMISQMWCVRKCYLPLHSSL